MKLLNCMDQLIPGNCDKEMVLLGVTAFGLPVA